MFQLIVVVLAIGMTALIVAGGVSYFNSDTGTRIQTQQQLQGHFDGLATAIATYRGSNNNFLSPNIENLAGLLPGGEVPQLSTAPDRFIWSIATIAGGGSNFTDLRLLCLSTTNLSGVSRGVMLGVAAFADNVARSRGGTTLSVGESCVNGTDISGPITEDVLRSHTQSSNLAIAFKGL
jgi:hypothetical protein